MAANLSMFVAEVQVVVAMAWNCDSDGLASLTTTAIREELVRDQIRTKLIQARHHSILWLNRSRMLWGAVMLPGPKSNQLDLELLELR